jgi:hypothetical protein
MKAMQIRAARRFLHSMLPVYIGSWEPSRTEMYRQVIIASHRYAFTPPAIALVEKFIGAAVSSKFESLKAAVFALRPSCRSFVLRNVL